MNGKHRFVLEINEVDHIVEGRKHLSASMIWLLPTQNYHLNGILLTTFLSDQKCSQKAATKKYGGYAIKAMNGKQLLNQERVEEAVLYVDENQQKQN